MQEQTLSESQKDHLTMQNKHMRVTQKVIRDQVKQAQS